MSNLDKRIQEAKLKGRYIQTARLFLMPLDVADAPEAFKWCGDSDVTKFLNYNTYSTVEDVAKWIADSGYNCFGFFLRSNGQLIGSGDVRLNGSGVHELGYNLAKVYWGKGYCTEAAKALLAHKAVQGINDFECKHAVDNVRSGRVIEKCGFSYVNEGAYTTFDGLRTFADKEYVLHINRFEMNVDGQWFDKIVTGNKTIELRLNDDKRRDIKEGDYIVLNNLGEDADLSKCVVLVTALHRFGNFAELYKNLDMTKCGYFANDTPIPDDMLAYYSHERQSEWGVVGIEFQLLCAM